MLRWGGLVCVLAGAYALSGCGSGSSHPPFALAGLVAAERKLATDERAGRYASACEAFTAEYQQALAAYGPGGCAEFMQASAQGIAALCAEPRPVAKSGHGQPAGGPAPPESRQELERHRRLCGAAKRDGPGVPLPAGVTVSGRAAYNRDALYARFENGRWRFEGPGSKTRLEAELREVHAGNGDVLLVGAGSHAK